MFTTRWHSKLRTAAVAVCVLVSGASSTNRATASIELASQTPQVSEAMSPADLDGDGIPDDLEQLLAERFAPVIFIHPGETNYPVNVDWFLARARLLYFEDCFPDVQESVPGAPNPLGSQSNLIGPPWTHPDSWGSDHPETHCGDAPDHRRIATTAPDPESYSDQTTFELPDVSASARVGSLNPADWKTYVHVYPNNLGGIQIQYWHVFTYNAFDFLGFGNHGGDWDASIQVVLDSNLNPTGAWYSRHGADHPGDFFAWTDLTIYDGTHPQVAIDKGGHAAFKSFQDCQDYFQVVGDLSICSIAWRNNPDGPGFGTVWKTWTGGQVRQDPSTQPFPNAYSISPNPSVTGGIVNLGEYNPGARQASPILAGQFRPLNGQTFTQYSGRWGSLGLIFSGPRGPVFQGYDSGVYRSWYNQAAAAPATPTTHPWREPPKTNRTVGIPRFVSGGTTYVSPRTPFSLAVTENRVAEAEGSATTYFRLVADNSIPGAFGAYAGPFSISGPDGSYRLDYYSVDALGNLEAVHSAVFILDGTGPAISISDPRATDYSHPSLLTVAFGGNDGTGSGVSTFDATLDGASTAGGVPIQSGSVIDFLDLSLGAHVFTVSAIDRVGNTSNSTVRFNILANPGSLHDDVARFAQLDKLKTQLEKSLNSKLDAADATQLRDHCATANNIYGALINEVQAQSGKGIDSAAAAVIVADAQYVMAHCV